MASLACNVSNLVMFYNGTWSDGYTSDTAYIGRGWNASYYNAVFRLTTPDFTGSAKAVRFHFTATTGDGASGTLRWALLRSDENKAAYVKTGAAVADSNQVAQGTLEYSGMSAQANPVDFTMEVSALAPGATYYLMLWAATDSAGAHFLTYWENAWAELEVQQGAVRIFTGGAWRAAVPYVYRGGWKQARPYVHSGSWRETQ